MSDCHETQRVLWPADIMRVSDAKIEAALRHAEDCDDCRWFLEQDRRVAQLIRDALPRVCASRELRERLYTALARERSGTAGRPGRRWSRAARVAAVVAAGAALGTSGHWLLERQADPATSGFAEDYLRRVVEQEALASSDPQQIAGFFARELGVSMLPPEVPGYLPRRATICLMNGLRGGVVEYRAPGKHFSYYIIPRQAEMLAARGRPNARLVDRQISWPPIMGRESGLSVATWWDGEHQHAVVGDLPEAELEQVVLLLRTAPTRL
jgi:hypothetical protein